VSAEKGKEEELSLADKFRREKAIRYCIRGAKYVMGYLTDFPLEFIPDASGDPIEVRLRIWWKEEDCQERLMPTFVKPQLDKMEKDVSRIAQIIGDTKVPKPVRDDGAR